MPKTNTNWFTVKNEASSSSAEIMIYDKIGKDWYGSDGIAAKDFAASLKDIPMDRAINCRINSVGGNVWDGMAIYSMLRARKDKVTCRVDGIAASIASVIACAGSKTIMPKNALMMIHPPQALCAGDSEEMRAMADKLDVHAKAIAAVYADKTGKSEDAMLAKMSTETWMTGEDAKKAGFCDETTDEPALTAEVKNFDLTQFRLVPEGLRGQPQNKAPIGAVVKKDTMNKEQILALLKTHGIDVANDASDEVILAAIGQLGAKAKAVTLPANGNPAIPQNVVDLENKVTAITRQLEGERKTRIETIVNGLVSDCKVTAVEAPKAVVRAIADETYLDELRARPQMLPGHAPVDNGLTIVGDDVRNVIKAINQHIVTGPEAVKNAVERGKAISQIWRKEREKVTQVLNAAATNTIDSNLKRVAILQETIRAFATRVLALRQFSTAFSNVPLQGTDEIVVPYYALQTAASSDRTTSSIPTYVFGQATNTSMKKITLNKLKYQPLDYSSAEFRRQPWFDAIKLGMFNAEKLGVDIVTDVLSVVTAANFGAAVKTAPAAALSSDDVIDIRGSCNTAMWPDSGRSLIVDATVDTALQKDPAYKLALNIGGTDVIRGGQLPKISGFDYVYIPNLPTNSEKLQGFAAFASGILAAFSPIDPAPGVRAQLVAYEVVTDPMTGISFNYRHWGLAQDDRDYEIIECAYGYSAGEAQAIKRICTP